MKTVRVTIEGVTPLLMHKFTDADAMKASSGNNAVMVGDRGTPQEVSEAALYTDEEGTPIIPQPNLLRCIIDAGKFFKAGKSKVTTMKTSLIPACVFMDLAHFDLLHEDPWRVDTRPVRIPSTGGRILRHRPCFEDWRIEFEFELDETIIGVKLMREIVDTAGQRIGLGDFRPDCKGPFGRFKVTRWEIVNGDE